MARRRSRALVIDASVVQAAGTSERGRSVSCRTFLQQVLSICHRVVLTPDVGEEWNRHRSRFSRKWQVQMYGRKKVVNVSPEAFQDMRRQIDEFAVSEDDRDAMRKDLPLILAAVAADRCIVSLDEEARELFSQAASRIGSLRLLVWVNPESDRDDPIAWLQRGAPLEHGRRLSR